MFSIFKRPERTRFLHGGIAAVLSSALFFAPQSPAAAQAGRVPVVRDAEIEALVRDYADPVFRAAGLRPGIDIILVNDPAFNAFVAGRRMFINTGALMIAESPNEIIGVIAHEAGHLAGGHQERLRDQISRAQTMAIVAALLGIGAGVAGAASGQHNMAGLGAGLAAGGAEMARRGLLGYQRTEEATADRSALVYLEKTRQSPRGMIRTVERFASALSLSGSRVDPYQLSHPLPRERIASLDEAARRSPYYDKADPPELMLRHELARAKIAAYTQAPGTAARLYKRLKNPLAVQYGETISAYLYGNPREALGKVDELIRKSPNNPYFHELRGEILIKANRPADAAAAFERASRLDKHKDPLIKVGQGQALLASGKPGDIEKAVGIFKAAIAADRENPAAYFMLAQAEGRLGNVPGAELATAEAHFFRGNFQEAKIFATRAQSKLKRGSPGWLRAQDIISFTVPGKKK